MPRSKSKGACAVAASQASRVNVPSRVRTGNVQKIQRKYATYVPPCPLRVDWPVRSSKSPNAQPSWETLRPSSGELRNFSAATTSSNPNPGNTKCSHNVAQQSARVDFNASLPNCTSFVKHHYSARSCGHPFNRHHGPWSLACKRPPQARRPRQAQGCRKAEIPPRTVLNKMVLRVDAQIDGDLAIAGALHHTLSMRV